MELTSADDIIKVHTAHALDHITHHAHLGLSVPRMK